MAENGQIPLMLIHGAWSGRARSDVEELRETADDAAGLAVNEIVDHYAGLIGELDSPCAGRPLLRRPVRRAPARPRARECRRRAARRPRRAFSSCRSRP